jgi:predicted DsbA family dithiol-disulfide isomerase
MPLSDLFGGRIDLEAAHQRLRAAMDAEGLPYVRRTRTVNTRRAQELAAWAERQPGGDGIHAALFHAYFAEDLNLGDDVVLLEVASGLGLDVNEARSVLESGAFAPVVDRDWAEAARLGVTAVPTVVLGGLGLVGAQPREALLELARRAGVVAPDEATDRARDGA